MSKLTNTQIKNSRGKEKPYSLSDGLGLSIIINPNGKKWWRYRFQFNGKAKMMSLGTYPDTSLADARKRLAESRALVASGINPIEHHDHNDHDKDSSLLFKDVVANYLANIKSDISSHHYIRSESLLRLYATPRLGNQHINSIGHKEIQEIIVSLADSGKKASAKKLNGVLQQVFAFAVLRNLCEMNVCKLIETKGLFDSATKRNFATITEPTQVKSLLNNIKNFEGGHYSTKNALLFMALTSLRSANVRHARWEQINFEKNTMTIPKEEMKIERKKLHNAKDFVLPLSTQTMDLLDITKSMPGNKKYIFPSIRGDKPMSENAMLAYIRTLGYGKEKFTPHGFRAMFATIANEESDFDRDLIDAQLAHKVGDSVSQAYNRTDYFQKRIDLVQWWADWLYSL